MCACTCMSSDAPLEAATCTDLAGGLRQRRRTGSAATPPRLPGGPSAILAVGHRSERSREHELAVIVFATRGAGRWVSVTLLLLVIASSATGRPSCSTSRPAAEVS